MIRSSTTKLKQVALLGVFVTVFFGLLHYERSGEFFGVSTIKYTSKTLRLSRHTTPASQPLVFGKALQQVERHLPEDVYISLRTTQANHASKLSVLLLTWLQALPAHQVI